MSDWKIRFAIINRVVESLDIAGQFAYLGSLGYDGVELGAPTLGEKPLTMSAERRTAIRNAAVDAGVDIVGLHQLLSVDPSLSITSRDAATRDRTVEAMRRAIDLCHDLGGGLLVHGSPKQRQPDEGDSVDEAVRRATETFARIGQHATDAGVNYCIEPLARHMTSVVNTVEDAVAVARTVNFPGVCTMLDALAASDSESLPIPAVLDQWLPSGFVRHIHFNDRNRRAPGQGADKFVDILRSLRRNVYAGYVTVEPFEYYPDGRTQAAWAMGYLRAATEAIKAG